MILKHQTGNLLEANVDVIVHQANLFHTFGVGIAAAIKAKFPRAYRADLNTPNGDESKLGKFSAYGVIGEPVVVNLYSQEGWNHTNYNAMFEGLKDLAGRLDRLGYRTVGIPYRIGCGIADGNWEIVKTIIEQAFDGTGIEITIFKLPEVAEKIIEEAGLPNNRSHWINP